MHNFDLLLSGGGPGENDSFVGLFAVIVNCEGVI